MKRTTLEGGVTLVTYEPPPENFDPLTASPAELRNYGFPAVPQNARHRELYLSVLSQLKGRHQFVEPNFSPMSHEFMAHGHGASPENGGGLTVKSGNWSGSIVYPPQGESFQWVKAEWTIPSVVSPGTFCESWVGLDGAVNDQVLLLGVQCTVGSDPVFVWWWSPMGLKNVQSLGGVVKAKDNVMATLCSNQGAGSTSSTVYFYNYSTMQLIHFTIELGEGSLSGSSAEWIVSSNLNPLSDSQETEVADYGKVVFTDCEAFTAPGNITVEGGTGSGNAVNLIVQGELMSEGLLIDATTVECLYMPVEPPQPGGCQGLLQSIDNIIGDGRHLPGATLEKWKLQLRMCLSEGKITQSEYDIAIQLIQSREP